MRWGQAAEVIRPAPVQATDHVPPRSVARGMPRRKAALEDLVCHRGGASCQQAVMLSACGQGTGTTWTAMHKSPTEILQNAQWRMGTALRLGLTPGPRACPCARATRVKRAITHWRGTLSEANTVVPGWTYRAVLCTLSRRISQADMERHV